MLKRISSVAWLATVLSAAACEGPAGPTGVAGPEGPPGGAGEDGPAGGDGADGVDGDDGANGTNGDDGTDGDDGAPGSDGSDGNDGRNAYAVGGGIVATVEDVTIDANDVATVRFTIADDDGMALDADGIYTMGAVTFRFMLAWLAEDADGEALQYTSYVVDADGNASAERPGDAAGQGTLTLLDWTRGEYEYRFDTIVEVDPANADATHTLGMTASRTFDDQTEHANVLFDFRPDAQAVTVTREVVLTDNCNNCHDPLAAHGSRRREVGMCILCHSPQSDAEGVSVDFPVMVHKIHRGEDLPSVIAGTPYVIGDADFSTVVFPQEVNRCEACHEGAAQGDRWMTLGRAMCATCHDTTSFVDPPPAGMVLHSGGAAANDQQCTICHQDNGFAPSVTEAHYTSFTDPAAPLVELDLLGATNTGPGQTPTLTFQVRVDGAVRDILASPLTRLAVTVAGPNTDFTSYWQNTIQGSGASGAPIANGENFDYTMSTPMPADASGSYTIGLEGYLQADAGSPRYSAYNPILAVAVTDAEPQPRRVVVERERCNACHFELGAHGGQRRNPNYCTLCHHPNNANDERIARFESSVILAPSVNLKDMVHGIHRGEDHDNPYVLGAFPAPTPGNPAGTPFDAGEVRYPGDLTNCAACHGDGTWALPLDASRLPSTSVELTCVEDPAADGDAYCTAPFWTITETLLRQPAAAACLGCHDSDAAQAHAELNTTEDGVEACAVCHGPGSEFDAHP